ncbi:hypothetical protein PM3016_3835 [Paenibacillus mucilaginosus 3016]|uniref:Uncharacterized protein n=1 Tax=Paenibacillus mucilaginosus 3016 TaxID=1116391 RepID=H6NDD3_9BACL|nr:hypothetical protein [Paenibacillus mucilaginosus]AFC30646.1 hypothetical protein PM3016_3835 [Paenibacillus mucilaginosus 3016]WFA19259.1 hypothetical protein ERY13_19400 [Paenibacillus mucilaginosus]
MENIIYDTGFSGNEWFVLGIIAAALIPIWFFPRRFSPLQITFNMLIGIAFGLIFDHTIEIPPFDLYDLGDQTKFQLFDLFSYTMYAPFGYWYIYGYERLRMYEWMTIPYILFWAGLSLCFEWLGDYAGVFHYKNGYQLIYSLPVYLILLSIHLMMYRHAFAYTRWRKSHG